MKIIEIKVYQFDELSDKAKERAREWYREGQEGDNFFAESVESDAKETAGLMGLKIEHLYWSGFSSQGDGACIVGQWYSSDVKPGKVKEYAPKDTEIIRIAAEFERIAAEFPHSSFSTRYVGHYHHENSVSFDVQATDNEDNDAWTQQLEDDLKEAARDFMRWIYRRLEAEYTYQNADEQVDESIRANEYTFTDSGKREG